jgi:hypothetical protein
MRSGRKLTLAIASASVVTALVAAFVVNQVASASGAARSDAAQPTVQFGRFNYAVDTTNSVQTQANQWPFEVLQRDHLDQVAKLRAAETSGLPMTFLFYSDPMVVRPSDPKGYTTSLPAPEVIQSHPDWLLHDSSGALITRDDGGGQVDDMMDPGNVAYQNAAAANLISVSRQEGWAGVMLDEINETWAWTMTSQPVGYSSQQQWETAIEGYVHNVCGQIIAAGRSCYTNTGASTDDTAFWNAITSENTGSCQEFFIAMNTSVGGDPARATIENGWWQPTEDRLVSSENAGKPSISHAYAADPDAVRYALGSFLLAWQGHGAFFASTTYAGAGDFWSADFDTARQLGAPQGGQQTAGNLLWRGFANGYVVVNPHDGQQSATVNGTPVTLPAASAELVATH